MAKKPKDNYFFFKSFFKDYRFDTIVEAAKIHRIFTGKIFLKILQKNKVKYINFMQAV